MSKANNATTTAETHHAMSRRSMLAATGGLAAGAIAAAPAFASHDEPEWPEFRPWYAIMLEEEQHFIQLSQIPDDELPESDELTRLHQSILERMWPLEEAMRARRPQSPSNKAIPAIVALYCSDKPFDGQYPDRRLVLGESLDHDDAFQCAALSAIEATVRDAVENNLLPGVVIWGGRRQR